MEKWNPGSGMTRSALAISVYSQGLHKILKYTLFISIDIYICIYIYRYYIDIDNAAAGGAFCIC